MSSLVRIRLPGGESPTPPPSPDAAAVYVETFGCQMNEADAALIVGQLRGAGYRSVGDPAAADVILINTCAIREKAEDRVWGRTSQLLRHRKDNPDLVIGITGCMAEHLREKVAERAPYISIVAGPDSYRQIADLVARARGGETVVDVTLDKTEDYAGLDGIPDDDGVSGHVTIQRGCDKFCSFCVVPYTRGRERAVPPGEVLRVGARLARAGYREIVLLGQTVNSYRHEDVDFAQLLRAVARIDGIARVRFTSPYPCDVSDALVEAMAEVPEVCPQIHLPLQSGSDGVLARMKRGYDTAAYLSIVERLRAAIPELAISTDLMVGFCGETEDEHRATIAMMEAVRFDTAFTFAYSDRGITQAARRLADDVAPEIKARRLQEVVDLQERHTRESHARWVGRTVEVLINGPARRGDALTGRTPQFQRVLLAMDPDGTHRGARAGDVVRVEIAASTGHSLVARASATPA